jgi:transposase InsO family protein
VAFIDDLDGWATVKFVQYKHHVKEAVKTYVREYERDFETVIQALHSLADITEGRHKTYVRRRDSITGFHSDHGGQFIDGQLQQWAKDTNTAWFFSAPYVHQQNGKIERLMRVLGERTRAVLPRHLFYLNSIIYI